MQFSVIIPTHGRLKPLQKLLDSLQAQTYPTKDFEVIVIPSPGDESLEWLKQYQGSLHLTTLDTAEDSWRGKNVSDKRNRGAAKAQAPWLAFIDDDCVAHSKWLENAAQHIKTNPTIAGIEGLTQTPPEAPKTLTWKGMQRLAKFEGYQTCNIFYKKEAFVSVAGFDWQNFPWFLEDTDLAWSIIDQGGEILAAPDCVVMHPVGPATPWRLSHEARGTGLKINLYEKHPELYKKNKMQSLRRSHYLYLVLAMTVVTCTALLYFSTALALTGLLLLTSILHMLKLFWGLKTNTKEVLEVWLRTLTFPFQAVTSLLIHTARSKRPAHNFFHCL